MVYRELPGELPALQRAVARLQAASADRRALLSTAPERRGEDFDAQLMRCESELQALAGAVDRFDEAFAKAAGQVLRDGAGPAKRLDALLTEVPALARRLRATQATLDALRSSYASLGAAVGHAEEEMGERASAAISVRLRGAAPLRIDRSRRKVANRLELSVTFASRARLDPSLIRGIERARVLLDLGTRENTRRHDLGLSAELRRLVKEVEAIADRLNRESRGAGRALFELVAFA